MELKMTRLGLSAALALGAVLVPFAPAVSAAAQAAQPSCTNVASDAAAAAAVAAACAIDVEVEAARTELTRTFVKPSGVHVFESAVEPQRTKRPDGTWADIDLTLRKAGGVIAPVASTVDIRFSAGGSGPFATLRNKGKQLTLSWPQPLPEPTLKGDTATYANVLPDVDLDVRVTRTSFVHVLVVKTPAAAANPALRQIAIDLGGDVQVSKNADGSLAAKAGEVQIAQSTPAVMWNSGVVNMTPNRYLKSAGAPQTVTPAEEVSTSAGAGVFAKTAAVGTTVTPKGDLLLEPDAAMLGADAEQFPIYIDPNWGPAPSRWAYATSDNGNNTDYSVARVGRDPDSSRMYRTFMEFNTTQLAGTVILSAKAHMRLYHSSSCGNTYTNLYWSSPIISTMRTPWSTGLGSWIGDALGHANKGNGCTDSPQASMTMVFDEASIKSMMQSVATNRNSNITVGLAALNENNQYESDWTRWKKFLPGQSTIVVEYNTVPRTPTSPSTAGNTTCTEDDATRPLLSSVTPEFKANVQDADTTETDLTAEFVWERWNGSAWTASGVLNDAAVYSPGGAARMQPGVTSGTGALSTGVWRWKARTVDPWTTAASGSGTHYSGYTSWCEFEIDATKPNKPVVTTPAASPDQAWSIGETLRFTFAPGGAPADTDLTGYEWKLNTGNWTSINTSGTATLDIQPTGSGQHTLTVRAKDRVNVSATPDYSYAFSVIPASPEVARWKLNEANGTTSLADSASVITPATVHPAALTGGVLEAPGRAPNASMTESTSLQFDGDDFAQAGGSGQVLDTTKSFSVSAWVKLGDKSADRPFLTRDANGNASFLFQYQKSSDRWLAQMPPAPSGGTPADALSTSVPQAGVWTHLTATFDASARTLKLFVNGAIESTKTSVVAFNEAARPLWIGKSASGWFNGSLSDVRIWNRPLTTSEITAQVNPLDLANLARDTAGNWQFEECLVVVTLECTDASSYVHNAVVEITGGVTQVTTDRPGDTGNVLSFDGTGFAYSSNPDDGSPGPVLYTDQSFTVSAWVKLSDASVNRTLVAQDGQHQSGFFLQYQADSDGASGRWAVGAHEDADGTPAVYALSPMVARSTLLDTWTHLTGVYDSGKRELRLYVNGTLAQAVPYTTAWNATGPMTIGRILWDSGQTDFWIGSIDQVRAYSGVVTASDVKTKLCGC